MYIPNSFRVVQVLQTKHSDSFVGVQINLLRCIRLDPLTRFSGSRSPSRSLSDFHETKDECLLPSKSSLLILIYAIAMVVDGLNVIGCRQNVNTCISAASTNHLDQVSKYPY